MAEDLVNARCKRTICEIEHILKRNFSDDHRAEWRFLQKCADSILTNSRSGPHLPFGRETLVDSLMSASLEPSYDMRCQILRRCFERLTIQLKISLEGKYLAKDRNPGQCQPTVCEFAAWSRHAKPQQLRIGSIPPNEGIPRTVLPADLQLHESLDLPSPTASPRVLSIKRPTSVQSIPVRQILKDSGQISSSHLISSPRSILSSQSTTPGRSHQNSPRVLKTKPTVQTHTGLSVSDENLDGMKFGVPYSRENHGHSSKSLSTIPTTAVNTALHPATSKTDRQRIDELLLSFASNSQQSVAELAPELGVRSSWQCLEFVAACFEQLEVYHSQSVLIAGTSLAWFSSLAAVLVGREGLVHVIVEGQQQLQAMEASIAEALQSIKEPARGHGVAQVPQPACLSRVCSLPTPVPRQLTLRIDQVLAWASTLAEMASLQGGCKFVYDRVLVPAELGKSARAQVTSLLAPSGMAVALADTSGAAGSLQEKGHRRLWRYRKPASGAANVNSAQVDLLTLALGLVVMDEEPPSQKPECLGPARRDQLHRHLAAEAGTAPLPVDTDIARSATALDAATAPPPPHRP